MKELRELAEEAIQYHKTQHERKYGVADFPEKHYGKIGIVVEAGQILSLLQEVQDLHERAKDAEKQLAKKDEEAAGDLRDALSSLTAERDQAVETRDQLFTKVQKLHNELEITKGERDTWKQWYLDADLHGCNQRQANTIGGLKNQVYVLKQAVKKFYSYRMEILGGWERSQDTMKGLFEDLTKAEAERDVWKSIAEECLSKQFHAEAELAICCENLAAEKRRAEKAKADLEKVRDFAFRHAMG